MSTATGQKVAHQANTSDHIIGREMESGWSQCFLQLLEDTDGWRLREEKLPFSYCFDIFQALTWTNYHYPNFTDGDRRVTWHAQDHMSSLCQEWETAPGSLSCEAAALAPRHPDCKHNTGIDFAYVLPMATNGKVFEQIKESKNSHSSNLYVQSYLGSGIMYPRGVCN